MGLDVSICFGCKVPFKGKTYQGCERCYIPSNNKYCSSCGSKTQEVIERPEFLDLLDLNTNISSFVEDGYLILYSRVSPSHRNCPEMYGHGLYPLNLMELNKICEDIKSKILNFPELREILDKDLEWMYFLNMSY